MNAKVRLTCITYLPKHRATVTEYHCFAKFGSYRENVEFIKEWLRSWRWSSLQVWQEHVDDRILEDQNYARAITGWYFLGKQRAGKERVYDNHFEEFISDDSMPKNEPTWTTDKFKLWVCEISTKEVDLICV